MVKIAVILSSVRPGRLNDRVAKVVINEIKNLGHEPLVIDPIKPEFNLPLLQVPLHFQDPSKAPAQLVSISKILESADAFVVVSAEYNHTIPPALTNLMSHFAPVYKFKPSGICTYSMGPFGGVRAAMALRPFLAELGCISIPKLFALPTAQKSIKEDGTVELPVVTTGAQEFIKELVWYAQAMKTQRGLGLPNQ
ncbi:NAD(P)H:quinone oxidoreductase-like protein [Globomyces pollinis-pini]|nr:NAD(P)H:quinone oxidoreductase-like protein [Globomyces pollinis-pini]KAJ2994231.1 hypothetical protein HDV02_001733 [Globomyces sp. JEL0801]